MFSICIQLTGDVEHDAKFEAQIGRKWKEWKKYGQLENNPNVLISRGTTSRWDWKQKECHVLRWIEKDWISDQSHYRDGMDGLHSKMSLDFAVLDARMMIWWEKVMIALFPRVKWWECLVVGWKRQKQDFADVCKAWRSRACRVGRGFWPTQKLWFYRRWKTNKQVIDDLVNYWFRRDMWERTIDCDLQLKSLFFPSKNISWTLCDYWVTA